MGGTQSLPSHLLSSISEVRQRKDMDNRILNRETFTVIGKMIRVSHKDGENLRRIPEFWQTCYTDGTVERLRAMRSDGVLLGISMNTDHDKEEFTYAIAVESDDVAADGFTKATIPASTWAMFPSTGGLPEAIQGVMEPNLRGMASNRELPAFWRP